MNIIIPIDHPHGLQVRSFLKESLTAVQRAELARLLMLYERFTRLQLLSKHKLQKIEGRLYEIRTPIAAANLRFFGTVCGETLFLLDVFAKKRQKLTRGEISRGLERISSFPCP